MNGLTVEDAENAEVSVFVFSGSVSSASSAVDFYFCVSLN